MTEHNNILLVWVYQFDLRVVITNNIILWELSLKTTATIPRWMCVVYSGHRCDRQLCNFSEKTVNNNVAFPRLEQHSLTHSLTHGAEPFLRSYQLCSYSRTSQHFMESDGPLACSQELSAGPYPKPDQSNPSHPSNIHFNIVHPPTSSSSKWSKETPGFPTNILHAFLFSPFVLHALPISSSTWSF
jgi:hypothetical protein